MRSQAFDEVGQAMKSDDNTPAKRKQLIRLIRRIVREEIGQALDDHLNDCEHKEKVAEQFQ